MTHFTLDLGLNQPLSFGRRTNGLLKTARLLVNAPQQHNVLYNPLSRLRTITFLHGNGLARMDSVLDYNHGLPLSCGRGDVEMRQT